MAILTKARPQPAIRQVDADSGDWATPGWSFDSRTNTLPSVARQYYTPVYVDERRQFDRIGVQVATAAAASSVARMGIYRARASTRGITPGTLILDAGTVLVDVTGLRELTIDVVLAPFQHFFLVFVSDGSPTIRGPSGTVSPPASGAGVSPNVGFTPVLFVGGQGVGALAAEAVAPTNNEVAAFAFTALRLV